ncbi:DUF4157 domain-containing protein [Ideonella sp. 4Y11]|uniref:DUF4157 domain-containing protein n=1 Tax=Ideonella aquatica TaxID=2824119 RepID=A0A940YI63_9BURK|nr:DUF4157 domain-containing protein [Ideonella aquatica]MBQ0957487.1 DUF4157 domain-containing protein [Ideonella aquatica]
MASAPPVPEGKKPAPPPPTKAAGDAAGASAKAPAASTSAQTPAKAQGPNKPDSAATPGQGTRKPPTTPGQAGPGEQAGRVDRLAVRAKLAVSEPGDSVEREADAVADRVMRMATPSAAAPSAADARPDPRAEAPVVARAPAATAAGSAAQAPRRPDARNAQRPAPVPAGHAQPATTEGTRGGLATQGGGSGPEIARDKRPETHGDARRDAAGRLSVPADFTQQLGSGQPLDAQTRAFFEQRLQADLSQVRVHTDASADQAARQVDARAFTFGRDIVFSSGQYEPGSDDGKRLLAHELAHVVQQNGSLARMLMRQPAGTAPAGGSSNDIEIKGIKVPGFKYDRYSGKTFTRPANYSRSTAGSKHKSHWNTATATARTQFATGAGLRDGAIYAAVPKKTRLEAGNAALLVGEAKELGRLMQLPKWTLDGSPNTHDIDHVIELQIGGAPMDNATNLELRDSKANQASGRDIDADITEKLKLVKDKENGDPDKIRANPAYRFVFSDFANGGGPGDSSCWTIDAINKLGALDGITLYDPDASTDSGRVKAWPSSVDKTDFFGGPDLLVLYPSQRGGQPRKIPLKNGQPASGLPADWIPGFTLADFTLNPGSGDQLGSISMKLALPRFPNYSPAAVPIRKLSKGLQHAGFISVDGLRTKIVNDLKTQTPVPQTSPVIVEEVDIEPGTGLVITGHIDPSIPLLGGPIDFEVSGKTFTLSKTFYSGELKLPGPFKPTSGSLTVAMSSASGFSVSGVMGYEIPRLGEGTLSGKGRMDSFLVAGSFTFDKRLFDGQAELKASYEKSGETGHFSGSATLEITDQKIKGIKKARIEAKLEDQVFTLDGQAETSIPGVKAFSVGINFADAEHFSISGKGDFEGLPGIESGSLTMKLDRAGEAWELSGSGQATPKLPGGAKGQIEARYAKGVVLVRGGVQFRYGDGLLDGKVTVAVTNAASLDAAGQPSGEGGEHFKAAGEGDLRATLIKNKLDGTLKLRLLEDGSVRVGGGLAVAPFEVFGQYPADGGEFLNKRFSTPPVPLPGLGFSVGSVSVGVTFSASLTMKAHAAVGPGKLAGITLNVEEFDPATAVLSTMKFTGGGSFKVFADAGFSASAAVNLIFGAAVAELVGSVGAEASVGIPKDKPVLDAQVDFSYSQAEGLDLKGAMNLDVAPALKFRLFGQVAARLNLLVDTVTVWSKDWTLAEANYQLPVGIHASGQLGYNSKSGKITPSNPSQAIKVETPKLDGDAIQGVLMGDSAPPKVDHRSDAPRQNNPQVQRKPRGGAPAAPDQPPPPVDEGLTQRLGSGQPLDLATRGYFEQRLGTDLSRVQIHTSPGAQREAEQLSAHAFTVGQHIAFAPGEYRPDTETGRALLAHELAHVVQQTGPRPPEVARQATTASSASATVASAGQSYSVGSGPYAGTQIQTDPANRQLSLPTLRLPALKQRNSGLFPLPLPVRQGSRPPTDQTTLWRGAVQGAAQTQLNDLTAAARAQGASDDSSGQTVYFLTLDRSPSFLLFGAEDTLRPRLELPIWDRQGHGSTFQVDHVREMQLDGSDTDSNYELLEASANMGAGRAIADEIRETVQGGLQALRDANPAASGLPAPTAWRQVKNSHRVSFSAIRWTLPHDGSANGSRFWSKQAIIDGEAAAMLRPMSPTERTRLGRGGAPVLFASVSGGEPLPSVASARRDWLPRVDLLSWSPAAPGGAPDTLGTLSVDVLKARSGAARAAGMGVPPDYPAQSWLVRRVPGLNAGFVDPASVHMGVRNSLRLPGMSPIEMDEVTLSRAGLVGEGRVLPTLPLIADADIRIRLNGAEAQVYKSFSMDELRLPAPFHLDACDLTVFYGQRSGLGLEGRAEFSVDRLGSGHLGATASTGGGFALEGGFDLDSALFDRAHVAMAYRDAQLSLDGDVGIDTPGKVRGIRAAQLHLAWAEGRFSADGSVDPEIPGVRQAALQVGYGEDTGLLIGGRLALEANPAIRSGAVDVTLSQTDGRWRVTASGTAEPALPGVDSTLQVRYDDGAFDASFSGAFERGMLSGTAELGLTNRTLDAAGQPNGPPEPGAPLIVYGGGSATLQLAPWLQGTAGIRFSPAGECTISGEIALPDTLELFSRQAIDRSLFSLSTQIPIVPGIVAEVGGNLRANAGIGPGVLDEARIAIEYSPDHEENTHVTGDAHLSVPADAGLRLGARAGIGLGITGASATGGLELGGSLGIAGAAEASVHVDWMPSQGLQIDAEASVRAAPRFRFDVSGYVDVSVLGASLYEQTWELAACEVGADYAFGVRFPLRYREGEPFSVSTEDIEFEVPEIDPEALLGELGRQLF